MGAKRDGSSRIRREGVDDRQAGKGAAVLQILAIERLASCFERCGDGLLIVGINEDEERAKADEYLAEKPVTFPILMDPQGALMQQFGVRALPTTVFVDGSLTIQMVQEGLQQTPEFLIDALLKAQ